MIDPSDACDEPAAAAAPEVGDAAAEQQPQGEADQQVQVESDGCQEPEVELSEDILDPMEELPLDENLVEVLPTVVEEPENEAKEQKALLDESKEEVVDDEQEIQSVGDGEKTNTDMDAQGRGEVSENEATVTKDAGDPAAADGSPEPNPVLEQGGDPSYTAAVGGSQVETDRQQPALKETADVSRAVDAAAAGEDQSAAQDNDGTAEIPQDAGQAVTPEVSADGEKLHQVTDNGEKLSQVTDGEETAVEDGASAADELPEGEQQDKPPEDEATAEPQPPEVISTEDKGGEPRSQTEGTETNAEDEGKVEKKKRKKSKEERKKKKSVEEKSPPEEKSSKPALLHVRGGFSCGWVGPMLQLLGTMKKLDEFKVCYNRKYGEQVGPDGSGSAALRKILCADRAAEEQTGDRVPDIPEATIRAPPGEGCPRCGGAVFEAERMKSRFRSYHKPCFNCKACHRILDSTLACDGPDKDVYCKLCYAKKYGPKGYGFGGGKAFLQCDVITTESAQSKPEWVKLDRTTIKPTEGAGCPRCGGAVFAAERMMSKGQEWHLSCFSCRDCKRPLDSTIACDGPDNEIYCKLDYAKRFGPKGFGFGHAPTLVSFVHGDEDSQDGGQVVGTPSSASQPTMGAKAAPGEGCPRCDFAVFAAEMMLHNGRAYHRHCYICNECHRSLDSTNTCSGPENELLCSSCYGRQYGPRGVGYGQGAGVLSMG